MVFRIPYPTQNKEKYIFFILKIFFTEMITDHIVNMHSSEIVKDIQPAVETALAMVLEDIANKFLKHIPSEMVFPN